MVDLASLYGGYLKASRYSTIKTPDLERALKPYKITLESIRKRRGSNATDAALRHLATRQVISKYRKAKAGDRSDTTRPGYRQR